MPNRASCSPTGRSVARGSSNAIKPIQWRQLPGRDPRPPAACHEGTLDHPELDPALHLSDRGRQDYMETATRGAVRRCPRPVADGRLVDRSHRPESGLRFRVSRRAMQSWSKTSMRSISRSSARPNFAERVLPPGSSFRFASIRTPASRTAWLSAPRESWQASHISASSK